MHFRWKPEYYWIEINVRYTGSEVLVGAWYLFMVFQLRLSLNFRCEVVEEQLYQCVSQEQTPPRPAQYHQESQEDQATILTTNPNRTPATPRTPYILPTPSTLKIHRILKTMVDGIGTLRHNGGSKATLGAALTALWVGFIRKYWHGIRRDFWINPLTLECDYREICLHALMESSLFIPFPSNGIFVYRWRLKLDSCLQQVFLCCK